MLGLYVVGQSSVDWIRQCSAVVGGWRGACRLYIGGDGDGGVVDEIECADVGIGWKCGTWRTRRARRFGRVIRDVGLRRMWTSSEVGGDGAAVSIGAASATIGPSSFIITATADGDSRLVITSRSCCET